jgi:hypothetical protein
MKSILAAALLAVAVLAAPALPAAAQTAPRAITAQDTDSFLYDQQQNLVGGFYRLEDGKAVISIGLYAGTSGFVQFYAIPAASLAVVNGHVTLTGTSVAQIESGGTKLLAAR